MEFNDILHKQKINPARVLVLRHRPPEPRLNKRLPSLAAEKPDVFNAYQQTQGPRVETAMQGLIGRGYVASFIAHGPERALFVGLYRIASSRPMTYPEFWAHPAHIEMRELGFIGYSDERIPSVTWFDLQPLEALKDWKGKLIIKWTPPEISWMRRAHRNSFAVRAILEDSALVPPMPHWSEITLSWDELSPLPERWRSALSQWRGIYFIHDRSDRRGYVGSAYGADNLLGRWQNYAANGHGDNKLLKACDPANFVFSILQRVSPDMPQNEIVPLEQTWKKRLHTRAPSGLNSN